MPLDRRSFVQLSAGALLASHTHARALAASAAPTITGGDGNLTVVGGNYLWRYTAADDSFHLLDSRGRQIASGNVQPAIVTASPHAPQRRHCTPGRAVAPVIEGSRIHFRYNGVNGTGVLTATWRFDTHGIWMEPVTFHSAVPQDIVSLHYFASGTSASASLASPGQASLQCSFLVVPGISEGPSISPIVRDDTRLNADVWLGRGSSAPDLPNQQWGLPAHLFAGFSIIHPHGARDMYRSGQSEAFCCGLADLPQGDLFLKLHNGSSSLWIDYRSDLLHHLHTPGSLTLGATFLWAVAPVYRDAIAAFYSGLLSAGIIRQASPSPTKSAVAFTPQFCTWGAQANRDQTGGNFDEAALRRIYTELKASGMQAGLLSIDDKWEGSYGNLEHDSTRFPHFESFLDEVRADGRRIGLWAALIRCERPADLGLTLDQMLQTPAGKPYTVSFSGAQYYLMDFTRPAVAEVLASLARRFIARYKPDLLKFDFGYELPGVATAAPFDRTFSGERLLRRGLEIVVTAMREVNPDLVVMYYNLSPLFLDLIDLHSTDDMYMAAGEYEPEANRRIYFSSLLAPLGVPTYGSSGYDWTSAPGVWFDSVASGTIGSLQDFTADEQGQHATPQVVAIYNGLARCVRPGNVFQVLALDGATEGAGVAEGAGTGARARSWARMEDGRLTLLALRPPLFDEFPAQPSTLDSSRIDAHTVTRIHRAVHAAMPVVISSRTAEDIANAAQLSVVPYGDGTITLQRRAGKQATTTHHYFGGEGATSQVEIRDGELTLTAATRRNHQPLEWIDITIA